MHSVNSYMRTHTTNAHIHAYPSQATLGMKSCLRAKSLHYLIHLFQFSFNSMWKFRRVLVCLSVCLAVLCWQFDVFSSPCLPCLSICLRAGSMFIFRLCLYLLSLPTEDHCEQWHNKGKEQCYWYTTTLSVFVCVYACVWVFEHVCVCMCKWNREVWFIWYPNTVTFTFVFFPVTGNQREARLWPLSVGPPQ